jgi:hypothetical protein
MAISKVRLEKEVGNTGSILGSKVYSVVAECEWIVTFA